MRQTMPPTIQAFCKTNLTHSAESRKLRFLAVLILGTLPGFAAPATYSLSAAYAGGITATGTFTFDPATDAVSNVDVILSGPSQGFYNFFAEGPVVFNTVQTNSAVNPPTGQLDTTFLPTGSNPNAIHAQAQLTFQGVALGAAGPAILSPTQSSLAIIGNPNFVESSVTGAIAALGQEKHAAADAIAAHPALSLTYGTDPTGTNPSPVTVFSPGQGAAGVSLSPTLTWGASANTTSYAVYFGTSTNPPFVGTTANTSFNVGPLNPNTLYYWYLISENSTGSTQSFLWYFTTGASAHPAFFAGEVNVGSGVYYLQFPDNQLFGYYTYLSDPILYHYDMGFEAFIAGSASDVYLYDFTSTHWWYSSSSLFPYLYDFTLNAWIYYFPNTQSPGHYTTNPRDFANLTTGTIFTM
jgi:hypothetical protein